MGQILVDPSGDFLQILRVQNEGIAVYEKNSVDAIRIGRKLPQIRYDLFLRRLPEGHVLVHGTVGTLIMRTSHRHLQQWVVSLAGRTKCLPRIVHNTFLSVSTILCFFPLYHESPIGLKQKSGPSGSLNASLIRTSVENP